MSSIRSGKEKYGIGNCEPLSEHRTNVEPNLHKTCRSLEGIYYTVKILNTFVHNFNYECKLYVNIAGFIIIIIIIIITAIEFSLGGNSPYTSTDKTSNI